MRLDADLWAWAEQHAGELGISKTAVVENGLRVLRYGGDRPAAPPEPASARSPQVERAREAASSRVAPDLCKTHGREANRSYGRCNLVGCMG